MARGHNVFTKPVETRQRLEGELAQIKLKIEAAKLAKLEADLPKPQPCYTRYEDIPPPSPEDRARFVARLTAKIDYWAQVQQREKQDWYLSMIDFAP